jgi:3-oxoacyl-[acyl-carrier protein] reductase
MSFNINMEGDVVLVTGASRGIGRSIAEALGKTGATVVGTATSEKGAEAISAYMQEAGINGKGMMLNVTDTDSIDGVIKSITDEFGAITVLVNNAGITRDTLLMRMKDEDWDAIINTNLTSIFRLSKAVLRGMMKARKGRVVSISSVVGASGNPGQTNYAAAKAGIVGFSKSMAREVGARGITVNVVAPGFIDTDMTRELNDEQKSALLTNIPMDRLGQPEEIANAVLFLASDLGAYVTGETIHVNGGMYMS